MNSEEFAELEDRLEGWETDAMRWRWLVRQRGITMFNRSITHLPYETRVRIVRRRFRYWMMTRTCGLSLL